MKNVGISDAEQWRGDWSDAQRTAIVEELKRVLSHPTFKSSKRCTSLLSYLVDRALAGEEDGVKERTLGIEVFEREPNYDTNADPIVRRTANEIRKRLAQCYLEQRARYPARFSVDRGSYRLEVEFEAPDEAAGPTDADTPEASPNSLKLSPGSDGHLEAKSEPASKLLRRGWIPGLAAALLLCVGLFFFARSNTFRSPENRLWEPLLASGDRVILCVSDVTPPVGVNAASNAQAPSASPLSHGPSQKTPFTDTRVAQAISIRLAQFKRQTNLQPSSALTFQDFRQGPAVLIGGTINPWAAMLLSKLRYTLQYDPVTLDKWIQDRQNPSVRNWKINGKPQTSDTFEDYAVVTRFFDPDTGQWILGLSGLEAHGTEAAGELVADPAFAKLIPSSVRSTGNFQIVLRVPVMAGSTGPFEIVAVHTW